MKFENIKLGVKGSGTGCVYAHVKDGEVVYIGVGNQIGGAFKGVGDGGRNSDWADALNRERLSVWLVEMSDDHAYLRALEAKLICLLRPKLNWNGSHKGKRGKFIFNGIEWSWVNVERFRLYYDQHLEIEVTLKPSKSKRSSPNLHPFRLPYVPSAFWHMARPGEISW